MELVLVLCGIIAMCMTGIHSCEGINGDPCGRHYTAVTCGDRYKKFAFCTPKEDVERIISVHLDTRFNTRYCRSNNGTFPYGITTEGKTIWVSDFCYGTFCLCLEKENDKNTIEVEETESTTEVRTHAVTSEGVLEGETTDNHEETVDVSDHERINVNDTTKQQTDTDGVMKTNNSHDIITSTNQKPKGDGASHHSVTEEYTDTHPELNIMFLIPIGVGGLLLITLIITIACLCCKRTKKGSATQLPEFKGQNLSSSALVSGELLNDSSVYEIIPADRTSSQRMKPQAVKSKMDTNSSKHDYFTLAPEVCKFCHPTKQTDNANIYNRIQEGGEYDRLVSVPRTSVSDGSNYHHLSFVTKERKGSVLQDSATQTDSMESA